MASYMNSHGLVIEAEQWDGSEESSDMISKKFGVKFEYFKYRNKNRMVAKGGWHVTYDYLSYKILDGDYLFKNIFGETQYILQEKFEKHFKSITDRRVLIVQQLQKYMLEKLEENQSKGDDWREESFPELQEGLLEEVEELREDLYYIRDAHDSVIENAKRECGDVANRVAMILDKLLNMKKS